MSSCFSSSIRLSTQPLKRNGATTQTSAIHSRRSLPQVWNDFVMPKDGISQLDRSQMRSVQKRFDELFIFVSQETGPTSRKLSSFQKTQKKFDNLFSLLSSTSSPSKPSREHELEKKHVKTKLIVEAEDTAGVEVDANDKALVVTSDQVLSPKL